MAMGAIVHSSGWSAAGEGVPHRRMQMLAAACVGQMVTAHRSAQLSAQQPAACPGRGAWWGQAGSTSTDPQHQDRAGLPATCRTSCSTSLWLMPS